MQIGVFGPCHLAQVDRALVVYFLVVLMFFILDVLTFLLLVVLMLFLMFFFLVVLMLILVIFFMVVLMIFLMLLLLVILMLFPMVVFMVVFMVFLVILLVPWMVLLLVVLLLLFSNLVGFGCKFQKTWATKYSWYEQEPECDGKFDKMRCIVCSKINRRDKIVHAKGDNSKKNQGWEKALMDLPTLKVKK